MTLDAWLDQNKVSEREFGRMVGRNQSAINRYRRGERMPDRDTMQKIHKKTGGAVTANDFFGISGGVAA